MKKIQILIVSVFLTLAATDSYSQARDLHVHRLVLDDNAGNRLILQVPSLTSAWNTFSFPDPGVSGSGEFTMLGNTFNVADKLVQLTSGGLLPALNASNLTALNATQLTAGTLADARLSTNVALEGTANTFGVGQTFAGQITSTVTTGTAPLVIASTTAVANLNADLLDNLSSAAFATASHTHAATDITSGALGATRGGTGHSAFAMGDLLYADGTSSLARLPGHVTTAKRFLTQSGDNTAANAPAWSAITTGDISGLGTISTQASNNVNISGGAITNTTIGATGASPGTFTTLRADSYLNLPDGVELRINNLPGTAGYVLTSGGAGDNPTWAPAGGSGLATTGGTMTGTITSTHATPLDLTNAGGATIKVVDGQSIRINDGIRNLVTFSDEGATGTVTAANITATSALKASVAANTNTAGELTLQRARGTVGSPLAVDLDDKLGVINFLGYNDNIAAYRQHAMILGEADVSVNNSNASGRISFHTTNTGVTPAERMRLNQTGNLGIGTTANATNARLAIKDGHFQSQQTTAPATTIGGAAGASGAATLSNATDVAGRISLTVGGPGYGSGTHVTVDFNKAYSVAPIVVISAANAAAAAVSTSYYVTSTAGGFSLLQAVAGAGGTYNFTYHVIETQ